MKKRILSFLVPLIAGGTLMAQPYNQTLPQQCNNSNPGTNEVLVFTGNAGNASGSATLTITAIGDVGTAAEYVDYYNENNVLIGTSGTAGNCNNDVFVYVMSQADVLAFSADGLIQITCQPATSVNTSQCTSQIGTAAYCVTGNLTYPTINGADNVGISQIVSPSNVCAGTAPFTVLVQNAGSATLNTFSVGGYIDNGTAVTTFGPLAITGANLPPADTMSVNLGSYAFVNGVTYDIVAGTSMPNGVLDSFPANDTMTINNFTTLLNGTYTVGPTGDYATMLDAVTALNTYGVCGPVVFDVNGSSTFTNPLTLTAVTGASATNTITFRGHGATISVNPNSTDRHVIFLDGADYITIDSFNIETTNPTYGWGIRLANSADHNTITNNYFDWSVMTSTSSGNGGAIVATGSASSYASYADNANYTLVENNVIKGGTTGMYAAINFNGPSSTVGCVGNQIKNNTIEDAYVFSIRSYYQESGEISGNSISQPTKSTVTTFYGVYCYYSRDMTVSRNHVFDVYAASPGVTSTCYPFYNGYANNTSSTASTFSNNIVSNVFSNGTIYAIYQIGGSYNNWFYNTIALDWAGANGTGTYRGMYQTTASTNLVIKNNIISITQGGTGTRHGFYFNTNTSVIDCNNNDIYMNGLSATNQYVGRWDGTDYATLANWQTANTNAYDQNSVSADPIFALPAQGFFQPGSPVINNIGIPIAGITTDFDGAPRSATTPDPGAYEFTPANDDAGIIAVNGLTAQCAGNVQVTAELKNFGVASLFSATINWTVNGVVQTSVPFIGSLGTTNQTTVALGTVNMVNGVSYDVRVWTSGPNGQTDGNNINDTSEVLGAETSMSGIYTIGALGDFTTITAAANALSSRGVCGPVTMNVTNATYTGAVLFDQISGTSALNTITFNGNGSTISAAPDVTDRYVVRLNDADYITLDSFNIVGTDATYGWGIHLMNSADNNTIKNCTIDLSALTNTGSSNGACIMASSSTTSYTGYGDNANNTLIENNTLIGSGSAPYSSIVLNGTSTSVGCVNNQIIGNTISGFYVYGIRYYYQEDGTISDNDVNRSIQTSVTTCYPMYLYYSPRLTVTNNWIHDGAGTLSSASFTCYGIYNIQSNSSSSTPSIIANNIVSDMRTNGTFYGIYANAGSSNYYYYNTISMDYTASTGGTTRGVYQTTTCTDMKFQNNIISITRGGSGTKHGLYFNTSSSTISSDNNVIYMGSAGSGSQYIGRWSATDYNTMGGWRGTTPTYDLVSDSLDPLFTDIGSDDFTPNSFSGNNIAMPIAGITTDFFGATRNATTPDPGAIEFTPVPTNDSCHQAIPIVAGTILGTTDGATVDIAPTCVVSDASTGVWYSYVAAGDFVNISLCGSTYDTRLRVFTGSCGTFTCVTGNEDFCSTQSEVGGCTENGETYYILVHGNGTAKGEFTLSLTETPVTPATATATSTSFCPGDTVTLSAGTATGYLWNDGASSTTQDIMVTTAGTYYVVATDTNGCNDTSNVLTITEHTVVAPTVTLSGDTSFCEGDSVILTSSAASSYLWNDAGMSTTPSIVVNSAGTYQVFAVDGNGCGESSVPITTTELPLPTVDLGETDTICDEGSIVLDAGSGLTSYFWSTGDTTQTITFQGSPGSHTINVTVTDGNGCQGSDQIEVEVLDCTGINELNSDATVNVYPNPSTGVFYLTTTGFKGETNNIRLTDFQGKVVHNAVLANSTTATELNLSHLAQGIYMLTVSNSGQLKTMRLVIH